MLDPELLSETLEEFWLWLCPLLLSEFVVSSFSSVSFDAVSDADGEALDEEAAEVLFEVDDCADVLADTLEDELVLAALTEHCVTHSAMIIASISTAITPIATALFLFCICSNGSFMRHTLLNCSAGRALVVALVFSVSCRIMVLVVVNDLFVT